MVELLLGEGRVLARAERRHAAAHLVQKDVADLVHRLRLASGRRSGSGIAEIGVADVEPRAKRTLEQYRSGGFADLEHRVVAAKRQRGLLAHRLRQPAVDAQGGEPLAERPWRGGPYRRAASQVRGASGGGTREREEHGEERPHVVSSPACAG